MTGMRLAVLGLLAFSLPLGCRRETDPPELPPPRFAELEGSRGIPVRLDNRVSDRSIIASVAPDEAGSRSRRPDTATPAEEIIEIDDSTAEGVVRGYLDLLAEGQLSQLPGILVPEQQGAARKLVNALEPLIRAQAELGRVLDEEFPGHAIRLNQGGGPTGELKLMKRLKLVEINENPDDEDAADAIVEDTEESKTVALAVKKIEGHWRIQDPELQPDELEQITPMLGIFTKMADGIRDVADRIDSGEITDEQAAEEALGKVMKAAMGEVFGAVMGETGAEMLKDTSGFGDEEAPEEPEPAAAKPKERNREAVDEVYSGPGMPRQRR